MHEMALTRDVVDTVLLEAEKADATKISSVTLTIGYMRDIVEDLFEGLFAYLTRDTIAEGTDLIINRIPIRAKCNQCGAIYHIDVFKSDTWSCPLCNERDYKMISGMEFRIEEIGIVSETSSCDSSPSFFH